ncbi:glycoside hydrolase family 88/105 protein [Sunxiuqinia sp. sy24]|uniref:glycoside hydrolase family 88/105 protein n=1 Tax=Sunxiuqinia sp. sy24 TaxID=3461495 RepID=UPI0040463DBC
MKKVLSVLLLFLFVGTLHAADKHKLFKPNHIKKVMKKATFWQLKNPKHQLYDWTNGAFYAGVFAAYETTGSKKIWNALIEMGEANEWNPGPRLQHADDHAICQTYIDIYRIEKEEKMITPFRETADKIMTTPYKTGEIRPITWWWCDALFMAPPALVKLGVTLGEEKYLEFSDRLFKETYDLLFDQEENLYARDMKYKTDWKEPKREANGEKVFWSRGNGWVMGGLALVLEELPADYKNRLFYEDQFLRMAKKIKALQQADGLWRASLLDPESYPGGEASGSGFYTFALAWGINNGLLDKEEYTPVVEKAWIGLNGLLQADGHVGWTQPIGADPRANFSNDSWEVYGTGAFLLAGSEVIKMDW